MGNIIETCPIDISLKLDIVENVHIGQNCTPEEVTTLTTLFKELCDVCSYSYKEMLGIDPSIVIHEIKTYPDAKPVYQKLRPVHPRKMTTIKVEVEKLLKAGFIYPVPLIEWVSNMVPVTKKQGTIIVSVDYWDLNLACPKDSFPTPIIHQILDDVWEEMYFHSWMDFQDTIRSK